MAKKWHELSKEEQTDYLNHMEKTGADSPCAIYAYKKWSDGKYVSYKDCEIKRDGGCNRNIYCCPLIFVDPRPLYMQHRDYDGSQKIYILSATQRQVEDFIKKTAKTTIGLGRVITKDDVNNLKILLETTKTVDDFCNQIIPCKGK